MINNLREPLLDVSFHDHVENFLTIRDRLVNDLRIVLKMRYARTYGFLYTLNEFFELLV